MAHSKKGWFVLILTIILLAVAALPALAGSGDGSGGGQGVPLKLDSSSPYNGQTGVALPTLINMTFNKNVINMSVNNNNQQCFSLYAADGGRIPLEVIMADDQIEPEKKRDIALKPLQELKPGAAYTVKVSSALQAKSGVNLENDLAITFITAGGSAAPLVNNNPAPQNTVNPAAAGPTEPAAEQAGQGANSAGANVASSAGAAAGDSDAATSAAVVAPADGGQAAAGGENTTGAGPESVTGENGRWAGAVNDDQPVKSRGLGAGAWAGIFAGLLLLAAAAHVIYWRKR